MKYKATVIEENGKQWVEGWAFMPSFEGRWEKGFIPAHPEHGLEWAEREAYRQCKEHVAATLDGDNGDLRFEVILEREDMEVELLDPERYEFLSSNGERGMTIHDLRNELESRCEKLGQKARDADEEGDEESRYYFRTHQEGMFEALDLVDKFISANIIIL